IVSIVPAGMLTLTGCGTAETVGPEGAGTVAPAVSGVTVVVISPLVCPAAGGCTTVVVVVPSLVYRNHLLRLAGCSRLLLGLIQRLFLLGTASRKDGRYYQHQRQPRDPSGTKQ